MLRTDADPGLRVFDPAIRLLHWLTLALVAAVFALVVAIHAAPTRGAEAVLTQWHRSLGLTVWAVTLARLLWRQFAHLPNWPADMPEFMRVAAHASEYALYGLLLTQPVLGLLWTSAYGERANLFFIAELPALIAKDRPLARQLGQAHEIIGLVLLGLIAVHAAAALYHHFWRGDGTLWAMLPQRMRRRHASNAAGAHSPTPAAAGPKQQME